MEGKLKRPSEREFVYRNPMGLWCRYKPLVQLHLRSDPGALERERKKPGAPQPQQNLFAIEEIAENTRFVTDISFDELKAAHLFHKTYDSLLKGDSWLTVGRGGRPVRVVDACSVEERVRPDLPADGKIVFTLFSDLIARGPLLGFHESLDPKMLIELAVDEGKSAASCSTPYGIGSSRQAIILSCAGSIRLADFRVCQRSRFAVARQ